MKTLRWLLLLLSACPAGMAVTPQPADYQLRDRWTSPGLAAGDAAPDSGPARISFVYGDQPSAAFLENWPRESRPVSLPGGGESREVSFRDPATGLEVQVTSTRFADFPAVEWVARLKNTGSSDAPLLRDIQALDGVFALPAPQAGTLHWALGGVASFDDFAPRTTALKPGSPFTLESREGRSSSAVLPFFNLEGDGYGMSRRTEVTVGRSSVLGRRLSGSRARRDARLTSTGRGASVLSRPTPPDA